MTTSPRIVQLNAEPREEIDRALRACAAIDSWVAALADRRPWPDAETVLAEAADRALAWTDAEVEAALADHPRIGEAHAGTGASAAASAREQAPIEDDDLHARLADGNARYEARFGRIYLVRAAGRTPQQLLDLLEQRLAHEPAEELAVVRSELADIALLRLERLLEDPS